MVVFPSLRQPKGQRATHTMLYEGAQIVCLKQYTNMTNDGAGPSQIEGFNNQAIVRGFDKDGPLLSKHLEDEKIPALQS